MSVNTKMTALADEVRELSGSTEKLGLDSMTTKIGEANTEIDGQVDLLAQAVAALEGKASGANTSDATAVADEIFKDKTAYVADGKVTGTFTIDSELTTQNDLISQISTLVAQKANPSGGGGVETCTVTLSYGTSSSDKTGTVPACQYMFYENEAVSIEVLSPNSSGPVVLNNVIKGSYLVSSTRYTLLANAEEMGSFAISYKINGDATLHGWICFVQGTKITLSNNEMKEIQDITYNDELLVWDFDNGCYTCAKPLWIKKVETASFYYKCIFDDNTVLNLVGSNGNCHALFCLDDNKFEYANNCIGKNIMTRNGVRKLISCNLIEEPVEFYNIITDYHMNLFANNILTSTKMNNIYPIKDMKFIKDDREFISNERYGNLDIDFYNGLRLSERKENEIEYIKSKVLNIITIKKEKEEIKNV